MMPVAQNQFIEVDKMALKPSGIPPTEAPKVVEIEEKPVQTPKPKPIAPQVAETAPKEEVKAKIVETAIKYNYPPEKALAIAKAESGFDANAKNASSSASGVYQFINGTAQGYCVDTYKLMESLAEKNDPDKQIECAVKMLSEGGESHWNASRSAWELDIAE